PRPFVDGPERGCLQDRSGRGGQVSWPTCNGVQRVSQGAGQGLWRSGGPGGPLPPPPHRATAPACFGAQRTVALWLAVHHTGGTEGTRLREVAAVARKQGRLKLGKSASFVKVGRRGACGSRGLPGQPAKWDLAR